jgi:hypothetical protein
VPEPDLELRRIEMRIPRTDRRVRVIEYANELGCEGT